MRALTAIGFAILLTHTAPLIAQNPVRPQQPQQQQQPQPEDTIPVPPFRYQPPVSPAGAMLRSMLLPGWGQGVLGRRGAGAAFVFFEGLAFTMWVKSLHQQDYLERTTEETEQEVGGDDNPLQSKSAEIEDWFVLLAFNHLLAGLEAYVSANLWDFPVELEARALPHGSLGLGVAVPLTLFAP